VFPKEFNRGILAGLARCNGKHKGGVFILAGSKMAAIHSQKNIGSRSSNAFVAIKKRMIRDQMEKVRSCHRGHAVMQILAAKSGFRHRQRRFEQSRVADPCRAAVAADHLSMDGDDLVELQEDRCHEITGPAA